MSVNESKENIVENEIPDFKIKQKSNKIRLNVHTLNKKLNENKKIDFFRNIGLVFVSLSALALIMLISFKF